MRAFGLALLLAAVAAPVPAAAVTLRFDVHDDAVFDLKPDYYFFIDSAPVPDSFDATSFTVNGTTYGENQFGPISFLDSYTFFNDAFGGFMNYENIYDGAVLFTGTTESPIFKTGTFALGNFANGATLTISDPSAVPEPASWALMLTGFGAAGIALRRRKREPQALHA